MAQRRVTATAKDGEGDILALCNAAQEWSPRSKNDAISDIRSKSHEYFVIGDGGSRVYVRVIDGTTGPFLRTDPDRTTTNNLDELPDCDC